jgi:DNA-binding GntR family transcriptional regulator
MCPQVGRRLAPRQTLTDLSYRQLRNDIVRGRIKLGEVISTGQIAKAMGISSMPVRAALTRLETEGIVTILPQRGVIVSRVSLVELEELFLIRSRLEGLAAFLACANLTKADLGQLRRMLRTMKRAAETVRVKDWLSINEKWHHLIFIASGNDQLRRLLEELYRRGMGRRVGTPNVEGHMERRYGEHLGILGALERRAAEEAEILWREHILNGGAEILQFLREMTGEKIDEAGGQR